MSGREIIADPLNKKKKIELRQGGTHRQIVSRGCNPLQRGTFLRRAGEWPILGTSPASAPSEDDEKAGGRFSGGSIPGGYGKSPFSLDCTYHGCSQIRCKKTVALPWRSKNASFFILCCFLERKRHTSALENLSN